MILTMVYRNGQVRCIEGVAELNSRKNFGDGETVLVISLHSEEETFKVPAVDLDKWTLLTDTGVVFANVVLADVKKPVEGDVQKEEASDVPT